MNLEGLKKSMKRQEGQRSVKKYIVLFILLVIVVIFIVLKGADIGTKLKKLEEYQ